MLTPKLVRVGERVRHVHGIAKLDQPFDDIEAAAVAQVRHVSLMVTSKMSALPASLPRRSCSMSAI
jgi:hypothetical protein